MVRRRYGGNLTIAGVDGGGASKKTFQFSFFPFPAKGGGWEVYAVVAVFKCWLPLLLLGTWFLVVPDFSAVEELK